MVSYQFARQVRQRTGRTPSLTFLRSNSRSSVVPVVVFSRKRPLVYRWLAALTKAHAELDLAVDLCYRPEKFESDRQRVEFLFALYEKLTAPLLPAAKAKRGRLKPA
jgi:hypothetical protein